MVFFVFSILISTKTATMTDREKVTAYIGKHERWSEQLTQLRTIFEQTELKEEVKWGSPTYTLDGKLVAGMAAFKNHYAIWFHQGVFLNDPAGVLHNAQEGKTKAMRQWKFSETDTIDDKVVLAYINEATENCRQGKAITPQRKTGVDVPQQLQDQLDTDNDLKTAFEAMTPGKQREYAGYITEAKRDATKQSRLEKIIPMILAGKGLYDKYKNC